jgi:predicted ribosomally synthesized peptide with nif11-like leader
MPSDKFSAFIAAVNATPDLLLRVKQLKQPSEIISLASELGYDISEEDLKLTSTEITSQELESIFGGRGMSSECDESLPATHSWCCNASVNVPM